MVLLIILVVTAIILGIGLIVAISAFGAGAIMVFGDVIVCIAIIALLCARIIRKKAGEA